MSAHPKQHFIVAIHDIEPRWEREILQIFNSVISRVGKNYCCAVVPECFAREDASAFSQALKDSGAEIALHGYTHRNPTAASLRAVSLLTGGLDEFSGCTATEVRIRLHSGQQILEQQFGSKARVLIPPAWCFGPVTTDLACEFGLSILAGFTTVRYGSKSIPIATTSWDCGRIACLGYLGETVGQVLQLTSRFPCVVFHPRDIIRGFLPRALDLVDRLLESGLKPITYYGLAELSGKRWSDSGVC